MKPIAVILMMVFSLISLGAQTEIEVGSIAQINEKEIIVKYKNASDPLKINQLLHVVTSENKPVIMRVTYPMQTSAKCTVISGNKSAITKGMAVYDGDKMAAIEIAGKPVDTHEYKVNPANGHKYFITKKGTWDEAEKEAVEAGGHLVTLRSSDEEEWIKNTFGRNEYFWIGFKKTGFFPWSWSWISGEKVVYKNWAGGEPNNWQGKENVGMMNYIYMNNESMFGDYWNDTATDGYGGLRGVAEIVP